MNHHHHQGGRSAPFFFGACRRALPVVSFIAAFAVMGCRPSSGLCADPPTACSAIGERYDCTQKKCVCDSPPCGGAPLLRLGNIHVSDGNDLGYSPSAVCYSGGSTSEVRVAVAYQERIGKGDAQTRELRVLRAAADFSQMTTSVETVGQDISVQVGRYSALGVMPPEKGGRLVLAFTDDVAQDIVVADEQSPRVWSATRAESAGAVGDFLGLHVDSRGGAHVSYIDSDGDYLKYLLWEDGGILQAPVTVDWADDPPGAIGKKSSIAVDPGDDDMPYVSYYDAANGFLKVARFNPDTGNWEGQAVGLPVRQEVLRLSVDGITTLANRMIPRKAQVRAYKDGEPLPSDSVTLLDGQRVQIASFDSRAEYTIDYDRPYSADYGQWSSIAVDFQKRVHIAFYDFRGGQLVFATSSAPFSGSEWKFTVIDPNADTGDFPTLRIGTIATDGITEDIPMVSYYDVRHADLMFAFRLRGTWDASRLATTGWSGIESSLAVCPDQNVVIATRSFDYGTLRNELDVYRLRPLF